MGLQSEEIKQMVTEYAEKVRQSTHCSAAGKCGGVVSHDSLCSSVAAAVGAVGGAFGEIWPTAAASQSRRLAGKTDPPENQRAAGGQLTCWSTDHK